MPTVRQLMQQANPVRNDMVRDLRGVEVQLAEALGGSVAANAGVAGGSRRRLILAVTAAAAIAVAGGAGVVLMQSSAPPSPATDEPFFPTTEKLEGRADLILRGTIDSTRDVTEDDLTETVATVKVKKVAKGDMSNGTSVRIMYTPVGSGPETPEGLRRGGEYALLLERRDAASWNLVNSTQGYYALTAGTLTPTADNPVTLSSQTERALGLS